MTIGIDGEFKQILEKLESRLEKIDGRLTGLEIGQAELKSDIRGDIKILDEKIKGIDKRGKFGIYY